VPASTPGFICSGISERRLGAGREPALHDCVRPADGAPAQPDRPGELAARHHRIERGGGQAGEVHHLGPTQDAGGSRLRDDLIGGFMLAEGGLHGRVRLGEFGLRHGVFPSQALDCMPRRWENERGSYSWVGCENLSLDPEAATDGRMHLDALYEDFISLKHIFS
jgi:hypothetical protein